MLYTTKYPTDPYHAQPLFYWLPNDYDASKKYPVIVFSHGKGEAGTDINRVLGAYLPKRIKGGWEPSATNPVTGELAKFIVFGVQDAYWSAWPKYATPAIEWVIAGNNETKKPLSVDRTRFYSTGLSAGGQCALMFGCWDDTYIGRYAAINSMSPAVMEKQAIDNLFKMGKAKTPVTFWSGDSDGATQTAQGYAKVLNDNAGSTVATVTVFKGGHCCWDNVYSGNVKFKSVDGKKDLNLYEWFLQFTNDGTTPPPDDPPVDPDPTFTFTVSMSKLPTGYPTKIIFSDGTELSISVSASSTII